MNLKERAFLRELGERLRLKRVESNLTQAELGDKCGLHRTFIGSVERGERNISLLNLLQISRILRYPLNELMEEL